MMMVIVYGTVLALSFIGVGFVCGMAAYEFDILVKTLDKIKAEIKMYEADCRLQGGTDKCEKCNSNVFGSIYRIIDKYKAGE